MDRTKSVAAVVVTYNRKGLLSQCLISLKSQPQLDRIFVVDNGSTDGTAELISALFSDVQVIRLERNVGGAGGFHVGIRTAYLAGYDWIWVMDDDTEPCPDSLENLIEAVDKANPRPLVLASLALWSDGSVHPMNVPALRVKDPNILIQNIQNTLVPLRSSSFVSTMLHRSAVRKYGLPISDYFIWADDMEYTARILRQEHGVWVIDSRVVHHTKSRYTPEMILGGRYFFHVRNLMWLFMYSRAYGGKEKTKLIAGFIFGSAKYVWYHRFHPRAIWVVIKGITAAIFTAPKNVVERLP